MNPSPEQITAAQQANLAILFELAKQAFTGFEKLIDLNLQVMTSVLADTQENTQKAIAAKDPQELFALQASLLQPDGEKMLAYRRHLYDIVSGTQGEFAKFAEAQYEAHNRRLQELFDNLTHSAPAGSEAAVGALTSLVTATNTLCENIYQTAKQTVEFVEHNFNGANGTASKPARQAVGHASRAART